MSHLDTKNVSDFSCQNVKMAESQQNSNDIVKSTSKLNPPIIMKIEAPVEDTVQEEVEDNDKNNSFTSINEPVKVCSPTYRTTSANNSNPFGGGISPNKHSRGILKPSQLSTNKSHQVNRPNFILNPSRLNPFASKTTSDQKSDSSDKNSCNQTTNGEIPKFVPLIQDKSNNTTKTPNKSPTSTTASATSTIKNLSLTGGSTFVFGQNLKDRVVSDAANVQPKLELESEPSTSENSNGTSTTGMLFSSAIQTEATAPSTEPSSEGKEVKSLSEFAREYEESRAIKRKYEEVEVKTGEEEETNILSTSCKLFAFDKVAGSWQERGRGKLRLNDLESEDGHTQSRLVFRTSGSLRVVLNTKIWAEMTVEQASEKSIRITALDANGEIKVFLIMANIEDSKQLLERLQFRVQKEISVQKRKKLLSQNKADSGGH